MDYKNALITGASSGMGRGLAAWFAARGVRVFAAARRAELLESLREEAKGNLEPVVLDVSNPEETLARIQKIDDECGGLDLVIANAGVGADTPGKRMVWQNVRHIIDVNVTGAAATLCAALPKMVERRRGHLVGVASIASYRGLPRSGAYCGSKAFLATFLESLRVDLKGTGVQVTSLHPGFVKSELTAMNKFKMPFLLETADAVSLMGEAIERGDAELAFPWQMALAIKTAKAMPNGLYDVVARKLR
ncbi:MAG: SDR family NAD(P)-dependent oxidoreductase [Myxococcaceae bacterium]